MRFLLAVLCLGFGLLMFSTVEASDLPSCKGSDESKWQNCEGILTSSSGREYVGVFRNGKFEGVNENEVKYVGEYKNGTMHGQGAFTFADGDKYVGEFRDGDYHGQGTYTFASGDKYVGEWRNDKYHGQGTYTFASGDKYVGEWRDDKRHGQGTYTHANGSEYVGEYRDNKPHGQGTYTYANGDIQKGIWENGELVEDVLTDAMDRCLFENIDKITSDASEKIVKKKCEQDLRDLSISELREAYD